MYFGGPLSLGLAVTAEIRRVQRRRVLKVVDHQSAICEVLHVSTSSLRAVALPSEHGGWSLTLEPVVLGLLVVPSLPGFSLGLAALLVFVARTPIKVVLVDRWRHHWRQRSRIASAVAGVEVGVIVVLGALAIMIASAPFWWPFAIAAPLIAVELWHDMRSRSRRLAAELAGAIGVGSMAAAIALAGGASSSLAAGLWLVIGARSVAAITFVRIQVLRVKSQEHTTWHSDIGQAVAVAIAAIGLALDVVPALGVVAIAVAGLFDVVMVRRAPVPAVVLGIQQIILGLLVVIVTGLAVGQV